MRREGKPSGQRVKSLRRYLLDTYGDGEFVRCFGCGFMLTEETATVDRIIPGAQGGEYIRKNVQPLCQPCNQLKAAGILKQKVPVTCNVCQARFPSVQSRRRHHYKEHR